MDKTPGLFELAHNLTGGSIGAQGYWMPYECAKDLCRTFCYSIRWALTPIFGPTFIKLCILPTDRYFKVYAISQETTRNCRLDADKTGKSRAGTPMSIITGSPFSKKTKKQLLRPTAPRKCLPKRVTRPSLSVAESSPSSTHSRLHSDANLDDKDYDDSEEEEGKDFTYPPSSPLVSPKSLVFSASGWTSINGTPAPDATASSVWSFSPASAQAQTKLNANRGKTTAQKRKYKPSMSSDSSSLSSAADTDIDMADASAPDSGSDLTTQMPVTHQRQTEPVRASKRIKKPSAPTPSNSKNNGKKTANATSTGVDIRASMVASTSTPGSGPASTSAPGAHSALPAYFDINGNAVSKGQGGGKARFKFTPADVSGVRPHVGSIAGVPGLLSHCDNDNNGSASGSAGGKAKDNPVARSMREHESWMEAQRAKREKKNKDNCRGTGEGLLGGAKKELTAEAKKGKTARAEMEELEDKAAGREEDEVAAAALMLLKGGR